MCSLAARGLWIDMLATMSEREPRGFLCRPDGSPLTVPEIGRTVGATPDDVAAALAELEAAGVFSRDARGVIFCRGMVADERMRVKNRRRMNSSRLSEFATREAQAVLPGLETGQNGSQDSQNKFCAGSVQRLCSVCAPESIEYQSNRVNSSSSAAAAADFSDQKKTSPTADVVAADETGPAEELSAADAVSRRPIAREWDGSWPLRQIRPLEREYGAERVDQAMRVIWSRAQAGETLRNPMGLLRVMLQQGFTAPLAPVRPQNPFVPQEKPP